MKRMEKMKHEAEAITSNTDMSSKQKVRACVPRVPLLRRTLSGTLDSYGFIGDYLTRGKGGGSESSGILLAPYVHFWARHVSSRELICAVHVVVLATLLIMLFLARSYMKTFMF